MSIFSRLFGKKATTSPTVITLTQTVDRAITGILTINFTMLEWEPFSCALEGPAGSKRTRGYLIGLGEGIISQFQAMNPTQEDTIAAMSSAFGFVFGDANSTRAWQRVLDTIDEFQVGDVEVVEGVAIGRQDVQLAYTDSPYQTPSGLWRIQQFEQNL